MPSNRRAAAPASPRTGSSSRKARSEISSAKPSSESRAVAWANGSVSSIDTEGTLPAPGGPPDQTPPDQTGVMADVDVHRIFDRIAHLYDTGWLQRALYAAVQEDALAELR